MDINKMSFKTDIVKNNKKVIKNLKEYESVEELIKNIYCYFQYENFNYIDIKNATPNDIVELYFFLNYVLDIEFAEDIGEDDDEETNENKLRLSNEFNKQISYNLIKFI